MSIRPSALVALVALIATTSCREGDGTLTPGAGSVYVTSDPPGATILVDNRSTGRRTPDTLRNVGGRHDISVQLDTFRATYGFTARVFVPETDSIPTIAGPLVNRCSESLCYANQFRHYSANRVRFASNPVGALFLERGSGQGVIWPSVSNNSYVSGSMVAFAGVLGGTDTVALGVYDNGYLAGRPAPSFEQTAERIDLSQTTWVVPPPASVNRSTVRGIAISQHVYATAADDDIVMIDLVFRNITDLPLYAALDPTIPASGLTYDQVFIGLLLDPDIGTSGDDALSYEPDLGLVYAYDAAFDEGDFAGGANRAPGLVGLRILESPPGSRIVLNGWTTATSVTPGDWYAGQATEKNGWYMLSGVKPYSPDHADLRIGHLPPESGDVRISVSAGPVRLAPGDSAAVRIGLVLAEPVEGSFTSGIAIEPGEPTDRSRRLFGVATNLFERASAVAGVARLERRNP